MLWLIFVSVFCFTLVVAFLRPADLADEAAFYALAEQLLAGAAPGTDVRLGMFTLPWFPTMAITGLAPGAPWIGYLKISNALMFASTAVLAAFWARSLQVPRRHVVLMVLATAGLAVPPNSNGYNPMVVTATLGFVVACTLASRHRPDHRWTAFVGGAASVAVVAKPNVGMAAVAVGAVALAVLWVRRWGRVPFRTATTGVGVFAGTGLLLGLAPVAVQGGLGDWWHDLRDKAGYLDSAAVPLLSGLRRFADGVLSLDPGDVWAGLPTLVALAAVAVIVLAVLRRRLDGERLLGAVVCTAAALAMVYPRADHSHVVYAMPLLLASACVAVPLHARRPTNGAATLSRDRTGLAIALLGIIVLVNVAHAAFGVPTTRPSSGPFRGVAVATDEYQNVRATAAALRRAGLERPFLISQQAASMYLLGGLTNPTPYWYPGRGQLTPSVQRQIEEAMSSGRIRHVCLGWTGWSAREIAAVTFMEHLEDVTRLESRLPACDLRRVDPPAASAP